MNTTGKSSLWRHRQIHPAWKIFLIAQIKIGNSFILQHIVLSLANPSFQAQKTFPQAAHRNWNIFLRQLSPKSSDATLHQQINVEKLKFRPETLSTCLQAQKRKNKRRRRKKREEEASHLETQHSILCFDEGKEKKAAQTCHAKSLFICVFLKNTSSSRKTVSLFLSKNHESAIFILEQGAVRRLRDPLEERLVCVLGAVGGKEKGLKVLRAFASGGLWILEAKCQDDINQSRKVTQRFT